MKRAVDDDTDTIAPKAARARFVAAVKTKRVNENAKKIVDMTIEQLMTDDGGPVLYVPAEHKDRILRLYGGFTMLDFDELHDMNAKIGAKYQTCFHTMMFWMNETKGCLRDEWCKVSHDKLLTDVFNLVQSAVRSRVGECVWYS